MLTLVDNLYNFCQLWTILIIQTIEIFLWQLKRQSLRLVTFETLITILTIGNLNSDNLCDLTIQTLGSIHNSWDVYCFIFIFNFKASYWALGHQLKSKDKDKFVAPWLNIARASRALQPCIPHRRASLAHPGENIWKTQLSPNPFRIQADISENFTTWFLKINTKSLAHPGRNIWKFDNLISNTHKTNTKFLWHPGKNI